MPLIYALPATILATCAIVMLTAGFMTVIACIDEHWEHMKRKLHCRKRLHEWERLAADETDDIAKAYKTAVYFHYAYQLELLKKKKKRLTSIRRENR